MALKVLPPGLAHDPERLARFEREARLLATLNHSTIAQIYGIEEPALVMELESDGRSGVRTRTPQRLFEFRARMITPQSNVFAYSPHPDGQRSLVNALAEAGEPTINVITNWQKAVAAGRLISNNIGNTIKRWDELLPGSESRTKCGSRRPSFIANIPEPPISR